MNNRQSTVTILMADDDDDDRLLVHDALVESRLPIALKTVTNGEALLNYLYHRGAYSDVSQNPPPHLILLDLNLPKQHGLEVLREIKNHPKLRIIPVIVFTESRDDEDIYSTYDSGANSYIIKPATFTSLVEVMTSIGKYWLEIVELP